MQFEQRFINLLSQAGPPQGIGQTLSPIEVAAAKGASIFGENK
jgi:hypothetical protein